MRKSSGRIRCAPVSGRGHRHRIPRKYFRRMAKAGGRVRHSLSGGSRLRQLLRRKIPLDGQRFARLPFARARKGICRFVVRRLVVIVHFFFFALLRGGPAANAAASKGISNS